MEAGRIVAVWLDRRATSVAADAPAGTQVLSVDFPIDFDEDGGQLFHVETETVYDYTSADPDGDTITLSAPLPTGVSFAEGDALRVFPLADDFMANVRLDDAEADEEPITARIPHSIRAQLPKGEGIRDRLALEGEAVLVDLVLEDFVVTDVLGSQPVIDGTYMDPETVPPTRDGVSPGSSPTPTVQGGIGSLFVKWTGVANNDPVTYEVHLSVTSGFTADATTLALETSGTLASLRTLPDGSPLAYGTTYFVRIVAKDLDGAAPQSAQASGQLVKVNSPDIAANAVIAELIAAGAITAEKLEAVLVLATRIVAGAAAAARVELSSTGLQAFDSAGNRTVFIDAADGSAEFQGRITGSNIFGSQVFTSETGRRTGLNSTSDSLEFFDFDGIEIGEIRPVIGAGFDNFIQIVSSSPDGSVEIRPSGVSLNNTKVIKGIDFNSAVYSFSSGSATINHNLGVVPIAVLATTRGAVNNVATLNFTATTFDAFIRDHAGAALTGNETVHWIAIG